MEDPHLPVASKSQKEFSCEMEREILSINLNLNYFCLMAIGVEIRTNESERETANV